MTELFKNQQKLVEAVNAKLKSPKTTYLSLENPPRRIVEVRLLSDSDPRVGAISISRSSAAQFTAILEDGSEINVFIKKSGSSMRTELEFKVAKLCIENGLNTFVPVCGLSTKMDDSFWITETVFDVTPISTLNIQTEDELRKAVEVGFYTLSHLNSLGYSHNDPFPYKNIAVDTSAFNAPISEFNVRKAGYIFDFEWCLGDEEGEPQSWNNCMNDISKFLQGVREDLLKNNRFQLVDKLESISAELAETYANQYPLK